MIGMVQGVVAALGEDAALIDVQGVGYVVHAGARTLARLSVGEATRLHVETQVREDSIRLFGFLHEEERVWFVHLQTVQSVGARVALAILDVMTPAEAADAVAIGDRAGFARANGVGPKLAQRLATELAGKAAPRGFLAHAAAPAGAPMAVPAPAAPSAARADALSALLNLGIDRETAARALAVAGKALGAEAEAAALIRAALKEISEAQGR